MVTKTAGETKACITYLSQANNSKGSLVPICFFQICFRLSSCHFQKLKHFKVEYDVAAWRESQQTAAAQMQTQWMGNWDSFLLVVVGTSALNYGGKRKTHKGLLRPPVFVFNVNPKELLG